MITNAIISAAPQHLAGGAQSLMIGIIAGVVTLIDMAMNAWMHELYKVLGLFIALIVTNCAVLGRAESFSSRNPVLPSILDGAGMGIGFTWVLIVIGGVREILGSGIASRPGSLLLGEHFHWLEITVFPDFQAFCWRSCRPGRSLFWASCWRSSGRSPPRRAAGQDPRRTDRVAVSRPRSERTMKISVVYAAPRPAVRLPGGGRAPAWPRRSSTPGCCATARHRPEQAKGRGLRQVRQTRQPAEGGRSGEIYQRITRVLDEDDDDDD